MSIKPRHLTDIQLHALPEVQTSKIHISATNWRSEAILVAKFTSSDDPQIVRSNYNGELWPKIAGEGRVDKC